jgi:omega-6 fatty acid desaturase (delta-12 desaturase)
VCSSHYYPFFIDLWATHSWEASAALKKQLAAFNIYLEGCPGGWAEVYWVFHKCKFVENEGNILFYKNTKGLAASQPIIPRDIASDSGIELKKWSDEAKQGSFKGT